jgi:hypothetical protein
MTFSVLSSGPTDEIRGEVEQAPVVSPPGFEKLQMQFAARTLPAPPPFLPPFRLAQAFRGGRANYTVASGGCKTRRAAIGANAAGRLPRRARQCLNADLSLRSLNR